MYKVRLTKIRSNHNNLRSNIIVGETNELPKVGEGFQMLSEGIDFGTRHVWTSPIKHLEKMNNTYQFNTENSVYKLEILN